MPALIARRVGAVLAPIVVLLALAAMFAVVAFVAPVAHDPALVGAAAAAAAAGIAAIVLLYRQVRRQEAADRGMRSAESLVSELVESAMDPIVTVDVAQRIVGFNAAAEAVFGRRRESVMGERLDLLIPERFHAAHRAHVERFGATGVTSRRMGVQAILTGLRADGAEFPIEASISQHSDGVRRLYTVILRDVTERVAASEALRRSKEELQELSATAHVAREQEKSRIARELHDELGQALTMLQMDVAWCKGHQPAEVPEFGTRLERMQTLLKTTVAATRRIAADLRPLMLDDLGLVPAVEWLVENFTQRTGVPCALAIPEPDLALDSMSSNAVFRIVQEALTNIAKHAQATRAEVAIEREGDWIIVRVGDDGAGFAPQDPRKPNSFGLVGLRERAAMLRGEASIRSSPGSGTRIEVRLPAGVAS